MSVDLQNETVIRLADVGRHLPPGRRGRPVSLSCALRWVLDGVKSPAGEVVRLEAARVGGRWLTSVEALQRFADRQTPSVDGTPIVTPRSVSARRRAAERAGQELERVGI
jgi:hypothetical protein